MIPCCQRGSDAEPTAKALFRRGLLDAWRACSIGPEKHRDVRVRSKMRKRRDAFDTKRWSSGSWG